MRIQQRVVVTSRDRAARSHLTLEAIVATALRVMRDEGLERVTMRRLAQELETGPASLYAHVRNVAGLHGAMLDDLLTRVDLDPAVDPVTWRETLIALLGAYTRLLFAHPALARSVLLLLPSGPNFLRLVDAVLRLLRTGGATVRDAAWGVDLLLQRATAIAAEQGTRDDQGDVGDTDDAFAAMTAVLGAVPAETYPGIVWARSELVSGEPGERLHWAFDALITGILASPSTGDHTPGP